MITDQILPPAAARIAHEGFAIIPAVFSSAEVASLSEALSRSRLARSRAGLRHAMREPAVAAFARHPRLLELARAVLSDGAIPFRATLFDKSPTSN